MMERIVWWLLLKLVRIHSRRYMDQFTMVKFKTSHGTVYLDILRVTPHPDGYDQVD